MQIAADRNGEEAVKLSWVKNNTSYEAYAMKKLGMRILFTIVAFGSACRLQAGQRISHDLAPWRTGNLLHDEWIRNWGRLENGLSCFSQNGRGVMKIAVLGLLVLLSASAQADWHTGTIEGIGINYDGKTPTFRLNGANLVNCTCSAWGSYMCLDPTAEGVNKQYALLLADRAAGRPVSVNIDEATCVVRAIGDGG